MGYKDIEVEKQKRRKYYQANKEKIKAASSQWAKDNPEKKHRYTRKAHLKTYGLTPEGYDALLERQKGLCGICGVNSPKPFRYFDIDHDHSCCENKPYCGTCIRGLLCRRCNVLLGLLEQPGVREQIEIYLGTFGS